MAYDAGMLRAVLHEINTLCQGAKVEKLYQPTGDEIDLLLHAGRQNLRLCMQLGSHAPRLSLSRLSKENPASAPMFCMLLRKHLVGARLLSAEQAGFERVAVFSFATHDEMGFDTQRLLVAEVMGKYSNLMLLDEKKKILGVLKQIDFTTSRLRQVLPGMTYELPPAQNKLDPLSVTAEELDAAWQKAAPDMTLDKWYTATFLGIAASTAREMAYRAVGENGLPLQACSKAGVFAAFFLWVQQMKAHCYAPTLLTDGQGMPVDYTFFAPSDPAMAAHVKGYPDFAALLDDYYGERELRERMRSRAADLIRLLSAAQARLTRKLEAQRAELAQAAQGEQFRTMGDLVTANIYRISRGMTSITATDYTLDPPAQVTVPLDSRLSPSANAQRFYKRYTKSKHAKENLAREISHAEEELAYLAGVHAFLDRAETEAELNELRDELYRTGYASRMKNYVPQKQGKLPPLTFRTSGGYTLLCGRNNLQNDNLTFKVASKGDLWFHVKGIPGSHVILLCDGEEPPEQDYTEAAELAAYYSQARGGEGTLVPVDYTRVKQVKKPTGAKPGYVIYHTNYTAYVQPRLTVTQVK